MASRALRKAAQGREGSSGRGPLTLTALNNRQQYHAGLAGAERPDSKKELHFVASGGLNPSHGGLLRDQQKFGRLDSLQLGDPLQY